MALKIDLSCLPNGELPQEIMRRHEDEESTVGQLEMLLMMLKQLFWRETESER